MGEDLQVIWELEPGTRVLDGANLPEVEHFDAPARLDAFLDAVRWGAASSADVRALQAPFRSGVDIEDYQLDPVVRALQMPRVNLLIADDVGLGKTIEAGLVMQELLIRHRARRVLIVSPSALQIHWHEQMRDKFGLEFRIVDSAMMKELRRSRGLHVNPWNHFPRLITSMDFLKRDRPMRTFRETLPASGESVWPRRYDLLIVDEAHNVAPSARGRYALESQRTKAIRTLTPHFEHRLFLTATPHNGYKESFTALLELIDNQRFARGVESDPEQKAAIVVRRLKSELKADFDGRPRFPPRRLSALEVPYTNDERDAHRWLHEYTRSRVRRVAPVADVHLHEGEDGGEVALAGAERFAIEFVLKLLKKRLFSSPAAFRTTLEQHRRWLRAENEEKSGLQRRASVGQLRALIDQAEEEYAEDEVADQTILAAVEAASTLWRKPTSEEEALLDKLAAWADRAYQRPDSKAETLIKWLEKVVKPNGKWSNERVILFTEYRSTQNWLQTLLSAAGLADSERLLTLYGGMQTEDRERIKAAFQADPTQSPVRILLATDAASEGIDLQRHCHRLVHLEIPWNPNRLEQRIGRIDRHGQRQSPEIFHFVSEGYAKGSTGRGDSADDLGADLEFLWRVAQKVDQIREDLGSVSPVISEQVTAAMLGGERRLDTLDAERRADPARRQLKFERSLRDQIERLRAQLDESRQALHLFPQNVEAVVAMALELAGQPALIPAPLPGIWPDTTGAHARSPIFQLPPLTGSWARCTSDLAHPFTGTIRPITFDQNVARGRDDVVLAHLNHPLVRMSMQLLRAEIWTAHAGRKLNRVTARLVPDHVLDAPAVVLHARLVIIGGDSQRLHEEIISAGGTLEEGRFRRLNVGQARSALEAATPRLPAQELLTRLAELWPRTSAPLQLALEARKQDRAEGLSKLLDERARKEEADIRAVLGELERSIRAELGGNEFEQLPLWSATERSELEKNREALRLRLEQIPGEIEEESRQISARYATRQVRVFPVAVTFLIPEKLNH